MSGNLGLPRIDVSSAVPAGIASWRKNTGNHIGGYSISDPTPDCCRSFSRESWQDGLS
jgi:hypothetical protein